MPSTRNLTQQLFESRVKDFQQVKVGTLAGQLSRITADRMGYKLTDEQVTYLLALQYFADRDEVTLGQERVEVPVQVLFSQMTGYPAELYKKHLFIREYMAEVHKRCGVALSEVKIPSTTESLVKIYPYATGRCRAFSLSRSWVETRDALSYTEIPKLNRNFRMRNYNQFLKPAPYGEGLTRRNGLPDCLVGTVEVLRKSRFRFNAEFWASPECGGWLKENGFKGRKLTHLMAAINGLNASTTEPQYHDSFHLQGSGRLHTHAGAMMLPQAARDKLILPVNPNNVRLEVDLKCAQLLFLAKFFKADIVERNLKILLEKHGTVWNSLGSDRIPKKAKKAICYGFCFGGDFMNLAYLANQKLDLAVEGVDPVTHRDVEEVFSNYLRPLVPLRNDWMKQYTVGKCLRSKQHTVKNDLGLKFSIKGKVAELSREKLLDEVDLASTQIAAQLLAHLAQGYEQAIIQPLIADLLSEYNILTFQYDGFTVEIPPEQLEEVKSKLQAACPAPLEFREVPSVEPSTLSEDKSKVNSIPTNPQEPMTEAEEYQNHLELAEDLTQFSSLPKVSAMSLDDRMEITRILMSIKGELIQIVGEELAQEIPGEYIYAMLSAYEKHGVSLAAQQIVREIAEAILSVAREFQTTEAET